MGRNIGVLRPLIGGGYSICRAEEKNVSRGKCQHTLGGYTPTVQNEDGIKTIYIDDMPDVPNHKLRDKIKGYVSNMSSGLNEREKQDILEVLRLETVR